MSRIITPDGMIPGQDGKPDRPPTMDERINFALSEYKAGRKGQAFAASLNCIAYLSAGLAGLAKSNEALRVQLVACQEEINKLRSSQ